MMLLSYLFGSERLSFSESERKRVFDLLLREKIAIDTVRESTSGFSLLLSHAEAKRLKSFLSEDEIVLEREEALGLPLLLRRLLRRSGILLGLLIGVAVFLFARSRVWEIRTVGEGDLDPDLLLEELCESGLSEGMSFRDLNFASVVFEMQKIDRRISWMQIRREGVHAIVEWIPTKEGDNQSSLRENCGANLVASKDAVIVDMEIESGEASVGVGSVVRVGDLLVSGIGTHSAAYAQGRVIGRVKERIRITAPIRIQELATVKTKRVGISFTLFGHRFSFGSDDGDLRDGGNVYLFGRVRLPIAWESVSQVEYTVVEREIGEAEAAKTAKRMLREKLAILLSDGELLTSTVTGGYGQDGYTLEAEVEYLTNIAKTLEFSIENE